MHIEKMTDAIETKRLVLFPYTPEGLRLFNADLPRFEAYYGVRYRGEELDYLLTYDPVGYADLILNGDVAEYLKNVTDYRPLDEREY